MKTSQLHFPEKLVLGLLLLLLAAFSRPVQAQVAAITYQGRLDTSGHLVDGFYDFKTTLYDAPTNGTTIAGSVNTKPAVTVVGGLFTIVLDLPVAAFSGADRWLEIEVRTNLAATPYTLLAPRQKLGNVPQAVYSRSAATAGMATNAMTASGVASGAVATSSLADGAVTTTKIADGTIVAADVNTSTFGATFWQTGGNAGTSPTLHFLGTTDNAPLELRVGGDRGLRLERAFAGVTPHLIGGWKSNLVSSGAAGSVIAGGGNQSYPNRIDGDIGAIGGGAGNWIQSSANQSVIAGGFNNQIQGQAYSSVVAGGGNNRIGTNAYSSAILGGEGNTIDPGANNSTVLSGRQNRAGAPYSLAAGYGASALHQGAFVWADSAGGSFSSTSNNQFLLRAGGGVGIGTSNPQGNLHVYGANNPALVRMQSSAGDGTARLEFFSNPQGSATEWRPAFMQSVDNGGFTGGLSFVVNGTGSNSRFGEVETMRIVHGRVGIGSGSFPLPFATLTVDGTIGFPNVATPAMYAYPSGTANPEKPLIVHSPAFAGYGLYYRDVGDQFVMKSSPGDTMPSLVVDLDGNWIAVGADLPKPGYETSINGDLVTATLLVQNSADWAGSANIVSVTPAGIGIGVLAGTYPIQHVSGARLTAGGTWENSSDRARKENFSPISVQATLQKVLELPITEWNYREDGAGIKHVGPTAQAFHNAFGLGSDDKHIATIDGDGIALVAIQGLNQKLEEELKRRDAENADLRKELNAIKVLLEKTVQARE